MKSKFLTRIHEQMQMKRYAKRTIESYIHWIKAYIIFNNKKHPKYCYNKEVEAFLSHLSNSKNVAPKTQALALNALSFLYKEILEQPLTLELNFNRSHIQTKLPTVLTTTEIKTLLKLVNANYLLQCQLMYGSGLRLMEVTRLRIQDIDFNYLSINIWNGKGGKHRCVTLAKELVPALKVQIKHASLRYQQDKNHPHYAGVWLPFALARKYPSAPNKLGWHYLFPSARLSLDPESNKLRRHHINETMLRKSVKQAAKEAGIEKNVTCHSKDDLVKCYMSLKSIKVVPREYVTKMSFYPPKAA